MLLLLTPTYSVRSCKHPIPSWHRSVCGPGSRLGEDRLASARYSGSRYYVFDGGCVGYRFSFSEDGIAALTNDVSLALGFYERAQLDERVKKATGLEL